MSTDSALMPDEPSRFTSVFMDRLLEHAESLHASDITLQSDEPIFAEIYGRLLRLTNRRLTNTEVNELINGIYGPNATTQLLSDKRLIPITNFARAEAFDTATASMRRLA